MSEALFVSLGGDAQDGVADAELGVTEEGGVVASQEVAGDLQEIFMGGFSEGGSQFVGLGFLRGGQRLLHGNLTDKGGGFFTETPVPSLVYKTSTNCRDAHTTSRSRQEKT